jgi:ureidoglycolate lyase
MPNTPRTLPVEALSAAAFAPFGDVVAARAGVQTFAINQGYATRFHDLACVDVGAQAGQVCVSVFKARPRTLPMQIEMMERHPLGSQAFVAMAAVPFWVVVAPASDTLDLQALRCFRAEPGQGVNYAKGVWHHPLIALNEASDFLVIDRMGPADPSNLDEVDIRSAAIWIGS